MGDVVFNTTIVRADPVNTQVRGMATAIDANNRPHLLFSEDHEYAPDQYQRRIVYGFMGGNGWEFETVATDSWFSGEHGLAIDASGNPHVALTDLDTHDMIYGARGAAGWHFEPMGLTNSWTMPAIEIDPQQRPAIAHFSFLSGGTVGTPVLTTRHGSDHWVNATMIVSPAIRDWADQVDLTFDNAGDPHIAYTGFSGYGKPGFVSVVSPDPLFGGGMTENRLHVAQWDETYFGTVSILAEPTGGVRVSALSEFGRNGELIHFSVNEHTTLGGVVHRPFAPLYPSRSSMALDADGRSWLVYDVVSNRSGRDEFKLIILEPDGTLVETVDLSGFGPGRYPSIVSDEQGGIHLFYQGPEGISYSFVPEPVTLTSLLLASGVLVLRRL